MAKNDFAGFDFTPRRHGPEGAPNEIYVWTVQRWRDHYSSVAGWYRLMWQFDWPRSDKTLTAHMAQD